MTPSEITERTVGSTLAGFIRSSSERSRYVMSPAKPDATHAARRCSRGWACALAIPHRSKPISRARLFTNDAVSILNGAHCPIASF